MDNVLFIGAMLVVIGKETARTFGIGFILIGGLWVIVNCCFFFSRYLVILLTFLKTLAGLW